MVHPHSTTMIPINECAIISKAFYAIPPSRIWWLLPSGLLLKPLLRRRRHRSVFQKVAAFFEAHLSKQFSSVSQLELYGLSCCCLTYPLAAAWLCQSIFPECVSQCKKECFPLLLLSLRHSASSSSRKVGAKSISRPLAMCGSSSRSARSKTP